MLTDCGRARFQGSRARGPFAGRIPQRGPANRRPSLARCKLKRWRGRRTMFNAQSSIERQGLESTPARGSAMRPSRDLFARAVFLSVWVLSPTVVLGQAPALDTAQRCREMLKQATQDKNPDIRKAAVEALSLTGPTDSLYQELTAMVEDQDVVVRT